MTRHARRLSTLIACTEAVQFADSHETLADAWKACKRPEWLLWLLARLSLGTGSLREGALVHFLRAETRKVIDKLPENRHRRNLTNILDGKREFQFGRDNCHGGHEGLMCDGCQMVLRCADLTAGTDIIWRATRVGAMAKYLGSPGRVSRRLKRLFACPDERMPRDRKGR